MIKEFQSNHDALGYYAVLELEHTADISLIKQNYRDMAKKWHPDYNKAENALEIFQKISVANDVLQDEEKRLIYDLLSCVYSQDDFPELGNIQPFKSESDSEDIRLLTIQELRGYLWKYQLKSRRFYCSYSEAVWTEFKTAALNWLLGWWCPVGIWKNIKVLKDNFDNVNDVNGNLKMLVHNAVAFYQNGKQPQAAYSAIIALNYAKDECKGYLQKFITLLGQKTPRPRKWNFLWLRLIQLSVPFLLLLSVLLSSSVSYVTEWDLMNLFHNKKKIDYYQEVNFGNRGSSVDDVVVGKILSIPVNRSDITQLYHLKSDNSVMYGPSEDFDILKTLAGQTTVRLTGISPDKVWARIMIDNGEIGFVKMDVLEKGIGKPIPEFSKIYKGE